MLSELFRLRKAVEVGSEAAVTKAVGQENLLLQTYGIVLPPAHKRCPEIIPGTRDVVATKLLDMLRPDLLHTHVPLQVAGDGNCLFRAISRAQYGTEDYYELLRLKTALELLTFPQHYDDTRADYVDIMHDKALALPTYHETVRVACTDMALTQKSSTCTRTDRDEVVRCQRPTVIT